MPSSAGLAASAVSRHAAGPGSAALVVPVVRRGHMAVARRSRVAVLLLVAVALPQTGHLVADLVLRRAGQLWNTVLQAVGGLLRRRAVGHATADGLDLLVALAACPRAEHEADGEAAEERYSISHLDLSGARHPRHRCGVRRPDGCF